MRVRHDGLPTSGAPSRGPEECAAAQPDVPCICPVAPGLPPVNAWLLVLWTAPPTARSRSNPTSRLFLHR